MAFVEILVNKVLWASVTGWAIAQMIKVIVGLAREKRVYWRYFVSTGGMPSAHSATVSSLATAVGMTQGFGSVAFAIAAIVAMVVMYDAAGLRRAVSRQSVILDRLMKELVEKRPRGEMERDLRQFIGHTPTQVIIGAVLGILTGWLWITL
ncbi:MAG: divergent PAP2 family protein [Chloroflexota bacterium]|nr:divergent PAP2 family protein [Chloroflexota bacterium]